MATDPAVLIEMYRRAELIKRCDERIRAMMLAGQLPGLSMYYSPRGQEFVSVGVSVHLRTEDYLVTTYRGLADHLAKGTTLRELWSEFLGREAGTCKGKGGPMHITDPAHGVMVTTGVVGSGLPVAVGLALASKLRGDGRVTVVNFGDGASNIGAFHESLNMASLWSLPVVFVCHNNGYAEHTAYADGTSVESIATRGQSYSMVAESVDGNDPSAMYGVAGRAVDRARSGDGPTLIEARTYRFQGHYFGDVMEYMPQEELAAAVAADPVPAFRAVLVAQGHATEQDLDAIDEEIETMIDDARDFSLAAEFPDVSELERDVYAEVAR